MKLSILIPVYNEERWLEPVVKKVMEQKVPGITKTEIVLVDDASKDKTRDVIAKLAKEYKDIIRPYYHEKNKGKGAGLMTAIEHMTGDICIIQDADLEYDPSDYPLILEPLVQGRADCVFGSRFVGTQAKRVLYFWHMIMNKSITLLSNMFTNLNLTDIEVGYKAFKCDLLRSIPLRSNRFGFEPEITAKIARRKCRVFEVGISYNGRTYAEGKKITWKDGVKAILCIIRYGFVDDSVKR